MSEVDEKLAFSSLLSRKFVQYIATSKEDNVTEIEAAA